MNQYYDFIDPAVPDTIVDAADYNREMTSITAAFDLLPSPSQLSAGTLNFGVSTGANNHYAVTITSIDAQVLGTNLAMKASFASTAPADITLNSFNHAGITFLGEYVAAGDIKLGGIYSFVFDGQYYQCLQMSTRYFGNAASDAAFAAAREAEALASKNAAATSATNAAASAATASSKVAPAQASATAASGSATTASNRASAAVASASTASTQASSAQSFAGNAASYATMAANSATSAADSTTAAAGSATSAANSATSAAGSATTAANAATAAQAIPTAPDFNSRVMDVILDTEACVGTVDFFAASTNPASVYPGTTWVKLPPHVTIRLANATGTDVLSTDGADTIGIGVPNLPAHSHDLMLSTPVSSTDLGTVTLSTDDEGTPTTSGTGLSGTSSSFDYGTKTLSTYDFASITSSNPGNHTHTVIGTAASNLGFGNVKSSPNDPVTGTTTLSAVGNHTHTFNPGSHSHTVAMGAHSHTFTIAAHNHTVAIGAHNHTIVMGTHTHTASMTVTSNGSGTSFSVLNSHLMLEAWYRSA